MKYITASEAAEWPDLYRRTFFNTVHGPKSLHLVATMGSASLQNLAPFNSVVHIQANPPHIGLVMRPHTVPRHTLENLLEQPFCTFNQMPAAYAAQAHQTSAQYAKPVNECQEVGLTQDYRNDFKVPYVKEALIGLGAELVERHTIAVNQTLFLVFQVHELWIDEALVRPDGFVDHAAGNVLGAIGLDAYYTPEWQSRYAFARPGQPTTELPPDHTWPEG